MGNLERDLVGGESPVMQIKFWWYLPQMTAFLHISEEFESHMTGLSSVMPRNFDENAHQLVDKIDDGAREIRSWIAVFLPQTVTRTILNIGEGALLVEVACASMTLLHNNQSTSYNGTLNWIQYNFIAREDRKFTGNSSIIDVTYHLP